MILEAIQAWVYPKPLFYKGITISAIIAIAAILTDLILNVSLTTQYFYILTYIGIILISSKATGKSF